MRRITSTSRWRLNYGFDVDITLPKCKIYITLGSLYIRYADTKAFKVGLSYR